MSARYINIEALIYVPDCENQCNYTIKESIKLDENKEIKTQVVEHIEKIIGKDQYALRLNFNVV